MTVDLTITGIGHRGEGFALHEGNRVFVPLALPGEVVRAEIQGDRATLIDILVAAPDRQAPPCPHFGACGGCQFQHLDAAAYRTFKTGLVERPLQQAGLDAQVSRFVDAAGNGRRRAALHADGQAAGYMRLRSHDLLDLDTCPILVPALARAPDIARAVGAAIGPSDIRFTATDTGIDVSVLSKRKGIDVARLTPLADRFGLARLAFNGEMLLLRQMPRVAMGRAQVELPVGSFLQATEAAETALAAYVTTAVGKAKSVADLFCGVGPFALRLAERAAVFAADSDKPAIAALDKAARHAKGLKAITPRYRDLFRDPLTRFELGFDAVVLDPPRAGAQAQVRELAASKVGTVVMVACDPNSFARDAAILVTAGFALEQLVAFDQFIWSTHIEVAATFRR